MKCLQRIIAWAIVAATAATVAGCAPALPPSEPPSPRNIAAQVLPGDWQVVDETVIFSFDGQGVPVAIRNEAHPEDFRTNVVFGEAKTLSAPIGRIDVVFTPGVPSIDEQTGEAHFDAVATGSNIVFLGLPILGSGHATYKFAGRYDPATGELIGSSDVRVYYGLLPIYSDSGEEYILRKIQPAPAVE